MTKLILIISIVAIFGGAADAAQNTKTGASVLHAVDIGAVHLRGLQQTDVGSTLTIRGPPASEKWTKLGSAESAKQDENACAAYRNVLLSGSAVAVRAFGKDAYYRN